MGSKKDQIQETPQQRAMAEFAVNRFQDWKQRWLPVQKHLISQIQAAGKEGSQAREAAAGKAATDTAMQFAKTQAGVQKALTNSGAGAGSSKFNLAVAGAGGDQAKSKGLGLMVADQMIDDAYVQGLSAIAATGRGERATVSDSLGRMARQSGAQAAADAEAALSQRMGNAQVAGQLVGFGLQGALSKTPDTGFGSVPGGYVDPGTGNQFNNPSGFTAG